VRKRLAAIGQASTISVPGVVEKLRTEKKTTRLGHFISK
jgi:hypothetical protein